MKNYADIYNLPSDSSALEQRFYIKTESAAGTLITPSSSDFIYHTDGSIKYSQPQESSPHKTGRHHNSTILQKKDCSWNFKSLFNIDTTLGSAALTEVDPAARVVLKSLFGKEDTTSGYLKYTTANAPSTTFSLFEMGDRWARQARGCFVMDGNLNFPGDGYANQEYSGMAKDALLIGMGKSTVSNNGGNTVTLQTGEGVEFKKDGLVMLIKADGTTRSTDTPAGSSRRVTVVSGDVVTLSGAALADADGSSTEVYLVYYEPAAATAINNPITGLTGSLAIVGVPSNQGIRNLTLKIANNHELVKYFYGTDSLAYPFFNPTNRVGIEVGIEMNLNTNIVKLLNRLEALQTQNATLIHGDSTGRHAQILLPKLISPVPEFTVGANQTIPVQFPFKAYQTALDAADEIELSFQ